MKTAVVITAILLVLRSAGHALAVTPPDVPPRDPELTRLPITAMLYRLSHDRMLEKLPPSEFPRRVAARGFRGDESGMVNVEIFDRDGDVPLPASIVTAHGGRIDGVWRGRTSAWIPPERAVELARALPDGYLLQEASLAYDNDEGPATVGSDSYINPGPGGQGMIVGIIDRNFVGLSDEENSGDVPVATRHNYSGTGWESGDIVHGVAHLETVYDHVPNATFHLFKIANATQLGLAVDDAINLGVNVLSATQSFYNEGWADDSGTAVQAANTAAAAGILYVSSSGNRAKSHWQGPFDGYGGGTWHDWGSNDWQNDIGDVKDSSSVNLYLQWERSGDTPDFDLYLYDQSFQLLDSSRSGGSTYEHIKWTNYTGAKVLGVNVAVMHISGTPGDLELFEISGKSLEYQVAAGSLTSPNNSTEPNVLAIGAVSYAFYSDGHLASYSSRGPTNSGARGIDLIGPTNTTTVAYNGAYGGTSCATPNTAGALAALWASRPELSARGIRILATHLASLYNDWGTAGADPDYGYGAIQFPAYRAMTQWLDRWAGNSIGSQTEPWYTVPDALGALQNGGRLLFLGGNYPEGALLDRPMILRSVVDDAVVGSN